MLCSLKEVPVCYVVRVICSFTVSPFLRQKQLQGVLDSAWSEAGHDYGQKTYCCIIRKARRFLFFFSFILKPNFKLIFLSSLLCYSLSWIYFIRPEKGSRSFQFLLSIFFLYVLHAKMILQYFPCKLLSLFKSDYCSKVL